MRRAFVAGLAGLRYNLIPGIILWSIGGILLAAYYLLPIVRPAFEVVAGWQTTYGLGFSGVLVGLAGGLVPFLVMRARGRVRPGESTLTLVFLILFWAYRGMEVDLFYRLQSLMFGDGNDAMTLLKKVLVDQFIYSAFWTIPSITIVFVWFSDCHRDFGAVRQALDREFWRVRLPGMIMTAWMVWIPMVCIINSIPVPLRVAILAIATVFWALCVDAVATRQTAPSADAAGPTPLAVAP